MMKKPITITLTFTLDHAPGVGDAEVHDALAEHLAEDLFEVTGEGDPAPTTPFEMGRAASQLLTEAQDMGAVTDAMQAVWGLLQDKSRELRVKLSEGSTATWDAGVDGWNADKGYFHHGRMKGY